MLRCAADQLQAGGQPVNNNINLLAPFIHMFYSNYPVLPLPDKLWSLLEIGVGGYIVGRSGEKIAGNFKKNN